LKISLTHGYFIEEDEKEQEIMRPYPPLGVLYISAWLEKNGYDNQVFDSTFSSFSALKKHLLKKTPDVVGIYTNLMTKLNVLRTMEFIRSNEQLSHTKIILGGPEVRNHIENFLRHGADFLVLGEGEETMLELVKAIESKEPTDAIESIAFLNKSGEVEKTKERALLRDLDELPMPNRMKIDMPLYFNAWKQKHGTNAISVNTMRGCPYTCKWCSRAVYGLSYRRRSAKHVVDEIEWIKANYDVETIWFVDDVFTVSHKWLKEFVEEVNARNMVMPFECITRADRMNEDVIKLLKKAGCFRVWIGAESGSQRIIDKMDRRVDVNQVREMIVAAQKGGISAGTFIMVGYPGETEEDIYETIHHLKTANPDLFTITVAYPIKGTDLYTEVESKFLEDLPWQSNTDRDIDFERTYPRKYYDYAVRLIVNEVNAFKAVKTGNTLAAAKHKAKALAAKGLMAASKR